MLNSLIAFDLENNINLQYQRGFQWHNSSFRGIDTIPTCCDTISDGLSTSNSIALNYKINILPKFNVGLGFAYTKLIGKMNTFKNEAISINGEEYDGKFEYAVEHESNLLNYQLLLEYNVIDKLYVNLNFGLSQLSKFDFYQYEKLVEPSNIGYFPQADSSKSRLNNEYNGIKQNVSQMFLIGASLSYEFPLNKKETLNLTPSISYNQYFGEFIDNTKWNFNNLSFGIGINYYFHKDTSAKVVEENIDNTLLLAPVFVTNNKSTLSYDIEYDTYNFDLELVDLGLTAKSKKLTYIKKISKEDTLRLYYKVGKFTNIQNLELFIKENELSDNVTLNLDKEYYDIAIIELLQKYNNQISMNLKLIDKQRIYQKNSYSFIEKEYNSDLVTLKIKENSNKNYRFKIFKISSNTGGDRILNMLKDEINDITKIKTIYSNSDTCLELLRELDNPRISYNPDNLIPNLLQNFIKNNDYIIIDEN